MITDETHPEMVRAHGDLVRRLSLVTAGRVPSRMLYEDVIKVRDDHRTEWRVKGVDFPHLVIFAVPRLRIMELWRADLDYASIRTKMMNLVMAAPEVTMQELALALQSAYPDFGQRAIVDEGEAIVERVRRHRMNGSLVDPIRSRA
jgi:hypothetical protein